MTARPAGGLCSRGGLPISASRAPDGPLTSGAAEPTVAAERRAGPVLPALPRPLVVAAQRQRFLGVVPARGPRVPGRSAAGPGGAVAAMARRGEPERGAGPLHAAAAAARS